MNERVRIFFFGILLYALTAAASLAATWQHVIRPQLAGVPPLELTLENGLIFLGVFIVFTFVMVRFIRFAHISLSFFLVIALTAGAQFMFGAVLPGAWSLVAAVGVVAALWAFPRVLLHDIAILLGIGGIAGVLGLSLTPLVASVLLSALSVYDIISVYRTRHMVTLAGRMMESGAVFGFLVPATATGFLHRRDDALRERSVMMLGSGDIGLPLVLACSALSQSVGAALLIAFCSLIGVGVMHWLFAHQKRPMPMAALPPIAVAAILGYAIAIIFGI